MGQRLIVTCVWRVCVMRLFQGFCETRWVGVEGVSGRDCYVIVHVQGLWGWAWRGEAGGLEIWGFFIA